MTSGPGPILSGLYEPEQLAFQWPVHCLGSHHMGSELPNSTVNSVGTPLRPGIPGAEPEVRIVSLVFF